MSEIGHKLPAAIPKVCRGWLVWFFSFLHGAVSGRRSNSRSNTNQWAGGRRHIFLLKLEEQFFSS